MNWRNFTRGMSISTLIFGGVLLGLTIFTSPESGMVTIGFYYISLFMFLMGLNAAELVIKRATQSQMLDSAFGRHPNAPSSL